MSAIVQLLARLRHGERVYFAGEPAEPQLELVVGFKHHYAEYVKEIIVPSTLTEQELCDRILAILPRVRAVWRRQIKNPIHLKLWEVEPR